MVGADKDKALHKLKNQQGMMAKIPPQKKKRKEKQKEFLFMVSMS